MPTPEEICACIQGSLDGRNYRSAHLKLLCEIASLLGSETAGGTRIDFESVSVVPNEFEGVDASKITQTAIKVLTYDIATEAITATRLFDKDGNDITATHTVSPSPNAVVTKIPLTTHTAHVVNVGSESETVFINHNTGLPEDDPATVAGLQSILAQNLGGYVKQEVDIVRLDSVLGASTVAVPYINFTGGTIGDSYLSSSPFVGLGIVWQDGTTNGSTIKINDLVYTYSSTGLVKVFPQLNPTSNKVYYDFPLSITTTGTVNAEIIIDRVAA